MRGKLRNSRGFKTPELIDRLWAILIPALMRVGNDSLVLLFTRLLNQSPVAIASETLASDEMPNPVQKSPGFWRPGTRFETREPSQRILVIRTRPAESVGMIARTCFLSISSLVVSVSRGTTSGVVRAADSVRSFHLVSTLRPYKERIKGIRHLRHPGLCR